MSVLLSVHNLGKSYGARRLFENITFAIESGQRLGLIGPNGAGKSTLMKILVGLEDPDEGKCTRGRQLRIGYLPQDPAFKEQTVFEALIGDLNIEEDYNLLVKVEELISLLELNSEKVNRDTPVLSLSGGWRKKVAIGRELMKSPDLLLMDEPTNHLDLESILWLEEFMNDNPSMATMTITHDRLFLENTSTHIFDLNPKYKDGFLKIEGAYSDYCNSRDIILEGQKSQEEARANDLRREMAWLRRGAKARLTKQKARIDRTYDLMDEVADLKARNQDNKIEMDLAAAGRSPKKLVVAEKISKSFGERVLFKDLDLIIGPKTRLGLLGRNGCGKSTLIRTLLNEIQPDEGTLKLAEQLKVSYFEQQRDSLNTKVSLLRAISPEGDYVHLRGHPVFAKSYLQRFRFRPEQHDLAVEKLSGGEQSRLLIARLMLTDANVLVLDEPTNDLDIATLDVLKQSLDEYDGALILVTHDRFFLDEVCDQILAFVEPALLLPDEEPGTLIKFSGYLQWQDWREKRLIEIRNLRSGKNSNSKSTKSDAVAQSPGGETKNSKDKKLSFKETQELAGMESTITKAEAEQQMLSAEIQKPEVVADGKRLHELSGKLAELEKKIAQLYDRWAELQSRIQ